LAPEIPMAVVVEATKTIDRNGDGKRRQVRL